MISKPIVTLWSLGEPAQQENFAKAFPAASASGLQAESETRRYQLTTNLSQTPTPTGLVLTYGATQTITPKLKSLLLMVSCFVSEVVVLLVGCDAIKAEKALDQSESNLRKNLSAQGFDGNAATILRVPEATLREADLPPLWLALDEKQLLLAPLTKPRALPKDHPNAELAKLMSQTRSLLRTALLARFHERTTNDALFAQPISTQLGGMPYLPLSEEWPTCAKCADAPKLKFLWQLDARAHLRPTVKNAGLYVVYFCDNAKHRVDEGSFVVKHYEAPSAEDRQRPQREAKAKFRATKAPLGAWLLTLDGRLEAPIVAALMSDRKTFPGYWSQVQQVAPKTKANKGVYRNKRTNEAFDSKLYRELLQLFAAEDVTFSRNSTEFSLGGYAHPPNYEKTPACAKCGKAQRILASVSASKVVTFLLDQPGLQFLICGCEPDKVTTLLHYLDEGEEEYDERYDDEWE